MGERIIKPWAEQLQQQGVKLRTGRRVTQIAANADGLPGRYGDAAFSTLDSVHQASQHLEVLVIVPFF